LPEGGCTRLFEDVGAGAEEFEEAEVAPTGVGVNAGLGVAGGFSPKSTLDV